MTRFPRPSKARPAASDGGRQVLIVLTIGMALTVGCFVTEEYVTARQHAAAAAAALQGDDEIYTGSILYMPNEGNICRQVLFDNHTGLFTDNGKVDCERAAYRSTLGTPKQWSAARVRVISTGFREH